MSDAAFRAVTAAARSTADVIADARAEGRAAFIGYLPTGFPDTSRCHDALAALVDAGTDIVEVGVPYSDPLMDGPVIQDAVATSLRQGTRVGDAFDAVRRVTAAGGTSVIMTYWNLVVRCGVEQFAEQLSCAGGSGLITPDLIVDEASEWVAASDARSLDRVFLVAPSSTDARLTATANASRGFVYAASTMGVTGARASVGSAAKTLVTRLRDVTDLPICVGLGVSTAEQAHEVAQFADGVIVGSALVKALADGGVDAMSRLARELRQGVQQ